MSLSVPVSKITTAFKRFFKNESANVTMMIGMAAIPMLLAAGSAVDMVRVNREQATFQAAVDAAVLAIAASPRSATGGLTGDALAARIEELEAMARQFLHANFSAETGNQSNVTIDVTSNNQAVQIMARSEFPMTIMGMVGIDTMELEAFAEVKKAMRPIELGIVMDTTGSMDGSKMSGARAAIREALDVLYGGPVSSVTESEYIRVALIPFAAAVRLNPAAYDFNMNWIDTTGANPISRLNFNSTSWHNFMAWSQLRNSSGGAPLAWNGCVESRGRSTVSGNLIASDTAPGSSTINPETLFPAFFSPDTPYNASTGYQYNRNNYIGHSSGSPNEHTGLTVAQRDSGTAAGLLFKQNNQAKYANRSISAELTTGTLSTLNSNIGPWMSCSKSMIVPMTHNRLNIDSGITAMRAYGGTNIAEGLAWGLRAMSPTEPFTKVEGSTSIPAGFIASYDDPKWRKVMVLVTDGDNDVGGGHDGRTSSPTSPVLNGSSYSSYGRGMQANPNNRFGAPAYTGLETTLNNDMSSTCTAIKAAGIELYVASYGSGVSETTRTRLRACGTNGDDTHYRHAGDSIELVAYFDHIGQETLNKMIYVSK